MTYLTLPFLHHLLSTAQVDHQEPKTFFFTEEQNQEHSYDGKVCYIASDSCNDLVQNTSNGMFILINNFCVS